MSSLALMRWLESAPERYDAGMRRLTFGRIDRLHEAVANAATASGPVLEIGCGTGAVTARLVARGLRVTAIDQSPEMLELTRARLVGAEPQSVELIEQTAAELERFEAGRFTTVVASLVFSDMAESERSFVLREIGRVLAPGGRLVVADEVRPTSLAARVAFRVVRAPQALVTWLVVGTVSRAIDDLRGVVERAGFRRVTGERWLGGTLEMVVAERAG